MKYDLGKVRHSAVIMNYGPGAIIDFRVPGTGAAVSVVAAGLEEWERQANEAGLSIHDLKRLAEPRLKAKLGVEYFRLPPIALDTDENEDKDETIPLIGARFPGWLQCPRCNLVKPARSWGSKPGDPSRFCDRCSRNLRGDEKAYVVPVRFITACRNGHLDDFPWYEWAHRGTRECSNRQEFHLAAEGAGLAGLVLKCTRCGSRRTMENIFRKEALEGTACAGRRPWLADADEKCDRTPAVLQRGASNLYFPQIESALVIPPWSEYIVRSIGHHWSNLVAADTIEDRHLYIERFLWKELDERVRRIGIEEFKKLIDQKIDQSRNSMSGNLRWDEYQQFKVAATSGSRERDEFDVRVENVPSPLGHLSDLLRVVSVREIRALRSFTRIEPPPGRPPVRSQFISRTRKSWLPAIEVRGEGIFIGLEEGRLADWENSPAVRARAGKILNFNESRVLNPSGGEIAVPEEVGARYLLLHSLAHILMKQLSLQCGYSSASLRERLYVGNEPQKMAGVMIYTATSDSDGTLGGLQRHGEARRFEGAFLEAIRSNEWCSSDPLCIKGLVSATESSSLAACHSCLLAPETSCEDFNRFLDRAMLVGTPEDRSVGFFADLLVR